MSSESNISESLKSDLPKILLGGLLGVLGTLLTGVLIEIGGPVVETVLRVSSGKLLLRVIAVLSILLVGSLWWAFSLRRRLRQPSTRNLKFEPYGGYYVDPKTGLGICTRCLAEGQVIHLMEIGPPEQPRICNACRTSYRGVPKEKSQNAA